MRWFTLKIHASADLFANWCHFEDSLRPYLFSTLSVYHPSCSLRSSSKKLLNVPPPKSSHMFTALSVIRLPLFGTHFHLKSVKLLLLLASKQISKPTSLRNCFTVPTDPSSRPVLCVCVCVCVSVRVHICVCDYFFKPVFCWCCMWCFCLFCFYVRGCIL